MNSDGDTSSDVADQKMVEATTIGSLCTKKKACSNTGIPCSIRSCQKLICAECYLSLVLQRNKLDESDALPNDDVACTLGCHRKALKIAAADPSRICWDDDTPNGTYEGSSEALLLDWLKTPGNYAHWRGNNRGITKQTIQLQVANMINSNGLKMGINRQRNEKQVGSKISYMEGKFRETLSFMENTGQGIREDLELSDDKFRDLITQRWSHFWDLFEIMSERSCMKQVFESETLQSNSASSSESSIQDDGPADAPPATPPPADNEDWIDAPPATPPPADNEDLIDEDPPASPIIPIIPAVARVDTTASGGEDDDESVFRSPVKNIFVVNSSTSTSSSKRHRPTGASSSVTSSSNKKTAGGG